MTDANPTSEARPAIKVICVDDHPDIRRLLEMAIKGESGMQLIAVLHRADEVLDTLNRNQADVVLIDMSMPGEQPLSVIKQISEHFPETRTVAFSAHDDPTSVDMAMQVGAAGYISKMKDMSVVMAGIRQVAEGEAVKEIG